MCLSWPDYASQLWSPHLLKSVYLIENVQRSFTKHIAGMHTMSYEEQLKHTNLYSVYSVQRRRDRYSIIHLWKIIKKLFQTSLFQLHVDTQNVEAEILRCMACQHGPTRHALL